jgi:hypothetical protein
MNPLIPTNVGTQAGLSCRDAKPAGMAAPQALFKGHTKSTKTAKSTKAHCLRRRSPW